MVNVMLWSQTMAIEILFFPFEHAFLREKKCISVFALTISNWHRNTYILFYGTLFYLCISIFPQRSPSSPSYLHLPLSTSSSPSPSSLPSVSRYISQPTKNNNNSAHRTICRAFLFEKKWLNDFLVLSGTDIHFYHVNSIYKQSLRSETNHYPTFDTFLKPHRSHSIFKRKKENNQLHINNFFRFVVGLSKAIQYTCPCLFFFCF